MAVVHSFSRFFRDHFELEFYVRELAKNGVKPGSITQETGDDPMHVMMRQIMALFDAYQSKENARHVLRALKEIARQGYWNGFLSTIGYSVVAAEQRGAKVKNKLEIDPLYADTVRLIYRLALEGDATSGPIGVKNITAHLNQRRFFTRDGWRWGIGQVHRILTRATYVGRHEFNKRAKSKELKPISEVIAVTVPPLIGRAPFDAVQAQLRARNSKMTHARVASGPTLLTSICFCADCGGAMTLRTGKGGRYRYYICSIKARQGETGCKDRSIPMEILDNLIAGHIFARTARELIRIDGGGYRREHLRSPAHGVEVADKEVRIMGSKGDLLQTLAAASGVKSATLGVRSSVPSWRRERNRDATFAGAEVVPESFHKRRKMPRYQWHGLQHFSAPVMVDLGSALLDQRTAGRVQRNLRRSHGSRSCFEIPRRTDR